MNEVKDNIFLLSCRICLKLLNSNGIVFGSVIEKIENCFSLKISSNNNLPQKICNECSNKLNASHLFKSLIQNSEIFFLNYSNPSNQIKNEYCSIENNNYDDIKLKHESTNNKLEILNDIKLENEFQIDTKNNLDVEKLNKSEHDDNKNHRTIHFKTDENNLDYTKYIYKFIDKEYVFVKNYNEIVSLEQVKNELNVDIDINSKLLDSCEMIEVSDRFIHIVFLNIDNELNEDYSNYRCNMCGGLYVTALALKKHGEKYHFGRSDDILFHDIPNPYRCRICGESFKHPIKIKAHRIKHKLIPLAKKFIAQCYLCQKYFLDNGRFYNHIAQHEGRFKIKCQFCDQKLASTSLNDHIKKSHTNIEPITTCQLCNRNVKNIKKHLKKAHDEEKTYECVICSITFERAAGLSLHNLKIHGNQFEKQNNDQDALCTTCGVKISRSNLKYHVALHVKEKNHLCTECGKHYQTKLILDRHVRTCHTNVVKDFRFECTQCDKKFNKKYFLSQHVKKQHENFRPFKCDICKKAFLDRTTLNDHLNTHSGLRPYECKVCNQTFGFKAALFTHNKLKHLKTKLSKKLK